MDDSLLAEFHSVFSITGDVNAPNRPHPNYCSLYKQKKAGFGEQEARRRRMLEQQRTRRKDYIDYVRKIANGEEWEEEMDEEGMDENQGGRDEVDSPPKQKQKRKRRVHPYRNQLMLSEWLVDVPPDFSENWTMCICPVGKRSLVVANQGTTTAYSRSGVQVNCFPSLLPGGCKRTYHSSRDYCILDCILYESSRTYHVLDVMCWRGHPVYDSDREFRHYWLRTKLSEAEGTTEISRINPYIFTPIDSHSCAKESLSDILSRPWPVQVDGLLFFHKHGHYMAGVASPLAVWLKSQMVTDILGVPVSEHFLACSPQMSDPLATPKRPQSTAAVGVGVPKTETETAVTEMDSGQSVEP